MQKWGQKGHETWLYALDGLFSLTKSLVKKGSSAFEIVLGALASL
jgi:hypothetical protein